MRYKFIIEYDGTLFIGWQRQAGQLSVQGVLEDALKTALRHSVTVWGSGRTDTGVHAIAQVAHIETEEKLDTYRLFESLNALVRPYPISIKSIEEVPDDFHARFSAKKRHYIYKIQNTPYPPSINKGHVWWVRLQLDIKKMQKAAHLMLGKHDFSTFRASECQAKSPIKTLDTFDIIQNGEIIEFHIRAKSFLHHQVRNMVGTLELVGEGKWSTEKFKKAFEACDRKKGGPTAPPEGLYFQSVDY